MALDGKGAGSLPWFAIAALEKLNKAARKAREAGRGTIPAKTLKPLITQFVRTVNVGLLLHPPEQGRKQGATQRHHRKPLATNSSHNNLNSYPDRVIERVCDSG